MSKAVFKERSSMRSRSPSFIARYAMTALVLTVATLLRFLLIPVLGERGAFTLYWPAIVICAWFGGLWPGLLTMLFGGFIAWYVFIPPQYSFAVSDPNAPGHLILFLLGGTLVTFLAESLHKARRRSEE